MDKIKKSKLLNIILISLLSIVIVFFVLSLGVRLFIGSGIDPTIDENIERLSAEEVIQINVLNACGVKGLAAHTRDYLRSRGFDVVDIGNYKKNVEKSFVIDRLGDLSSSKKVAYAVGIEDSLIVTKIDSNLFLRCSLVLGNDYMTLKPFK